MDEPQNLERKWGRKKKQLKIDQRITGFENPKKLCTICNKKFANGKALGGHMRVHAQDSSSYKNGESFICSFSEDSRKNKSPNSDFQSSETPVCDVCEKVFQSWKSLYGHMRCHPERQWRGILPPFDDSVRNASSQKGFDLLRSLPRWPVTGKRGRGCSFPAPESEILEAAQNLLWLSGGPYLWDYEEIGVKIQEETCSVLLENDGGVGVSQETGQPESYCFIPKNGSDSEGIQVVFEDGNKEKKKRGRKRKNVDPIINGPDQETQLLNPDLIPGPGTGFSCVTCKKKFSTYQALGGHRSKHYKQRTGSESCFCNPDPENGSTETNYPTEPGNHYLVHTVYHQQAELAVTPW